MELKPSELEKLLGTGRGPVILDVRSRFEFSAGHLPGAVHLPFLHCLFRASRVIPDKSTEVVLYCEHGPRAQLVGGLLGLFGYRSVRLLGGHMHRWRKEKRKIVRSSR